MKNKMLLLIMLVCFTSMAGDTTQPQKKKRSLISRIFKQQKIEDSISRDTRIYVELTKIRVSKNYELIDSLRRDSVTKN